MERTKVRAEAAQEASRIWDAAAPATDDHPYLTRKGINAHGVRQRNGQLIVPVRIGNELRTLQFIAANGDKLFLSGGEVKDGYFSIGTMKGATTLCLAEGFATGATIHQATGHPMAVSFNCGNLTSVAKTLRERFTEQQMILCADYDHETEGNPGMTKAVEAARAVGCQVATPVSGFEPWNGVTDFNDLAARSGMEAVRQAVETAKEPDTVRLGAEEWPELIDLDTPQLPKLDLNRLPSWASDFAVALSESTETPPELAGGLTISACSVAAARKLQVQVKQGHIEPCNLWLAPALSSGNRKSAVESAASAPLSAWERDTVAALEPEIQRLQSERKTLETRAKELRNKSAKEEDPNNAKTFAVEAADIEANLPEPPREPQLWTSDCTPERMGGLLADNAERMAWLSSEGGLFDLLQGRYSGGIKNMDLILKSWSGDADRVDRGGRPPSTCDSRCSPSGCLRNQTYFADWPKYQAFGGADCLLGFCT